MDISNSCITPPCCSTLWRHRRDCSISLVAKSCKCSPPRVYPLLAVSPLYFPFLQFTPLHSTTYVTLSVSQFPLPVVVQTKQSSLPHPPFLKGFDLCSSLFIVLPVRLTTLMRSPLFCIVRSYIHLSFPSGVAGMNRTESNPPCLYQFFFFNCFCSIRSDLFHPFGLWIGLMPLSSFSIMVM